MNKREWLQAIICDTKSLSDMSKSHPQLFNKVISDKDLEKLEGLTSNLADNVEKRVNGSDDVTLDRFDLDPQTT